MRMRRLAMRADSSAGMMASRNSSNGSLSRKKNDSFVAMASTTSTMRGSAIEQPVPACHRQQPAFDEVMLLRGQHEARPRLQKLLQILVILGRHERAPRNRREIFGAICSSGSTAEHAPADTADPGM